MEEFKGTNINVQFGISATADFEENTWTFEMSDGFSVKAGEYAILPKEQFELFNKALGKETEK